MATGAKCTENLSQGENTSLNVSVVLVCVREREQHKQTFSCVVHSY